MEEKEKKEREKEKREKRRKIRGGEKGEREEDSSQIKSVRQPYHLATVTNIILFCRVLSGVGGETRVCSPPPPPPPKPFQSKH